MKYYKNNIYLIWIGDIVPNYVFYSKFHYENTNPLCNVEFVHITNDILCSIYHKKPFKFKYKTILIDSINYILDNNKNHYSDFISIQKKIYGKNIRFIQILSDIFRLELLNKNHGIYVDCDTFPIKPFDESLFNIKNFIVTRYYDTKLEFSKNQLYIDNYFFGINSKNIFNLTDDNIIKILQTNKNFECDIGYLYRKNLYLKQQLSQNDFNKNIGENVQNFYIEHYHLNSWNLDGKIYYNKTPLCIFDTLL